MGKVKKCGECYLLTANVILTIITCILICCWNQGCTAEQLTTAAGTVHAVHQGIDTAAPVMTSQPWYIYVMLAADIASSCAAGLLTILKRKESAEKRD